MSTSTSELVTEVFRSVKMTSGSVTHANDESCMMANTFAALSNAVQWIFYTIRMDIDLEVNSPHYGTVQFRIIRGVLDSDQYTPSSPLSAYPSPFTFTVLQSTDLYRCTNLKLATSGDYVGFFQTGTGSNLKLNTDSCTFSGIKTLRLS